MLNLPSDQNLSGFQVGVPDPLAQRADTSKERRLAKSDHL
jgi:hypothetical protein